MRGENRSTRRKTSRSRVENQQQTQPTYDAGSGNRTRDTLVEASALTTAPTLLPETAESRQHTRVSTVFNSEAVCVQKIPPTGNFFAHSKILAPAQMCLLRKSSRITLKMSVFLRRLVIAWSDTAAEKAWAQGQISRYPGWYSRFTVLTVSKVD